MTTTPPEADDPGVARLRRHVGADASRNTDLAECWAEATALVQQYVGQHQVPQHVLARATVEVGSELYHRRNAPGGVMQQYTDLTAAPVRMARDPMLGAYPILDRFLPGGFA